MIIPQIFLPKITIKKVQNTYKEYYKNVKVKTLSLTYIKI